MPAYEERDIAVIGWSLRLTDANAVGAVAAEELDCFDPRFFGLTPEEASALDAERCILLQLAHEALENAGYAAHRDEARIGVFIALDKPATDPLAPPLASPQNSPSAWLAARLGLRGPQATVQVTNSPFLSAVQCALQSLLNGDTEMALVGAFSLHGAQVVGEARGGGVVILKRAADAGAQGDTTHVVIKDLSFGNNAAHAAPAVVEITEPGPAAEVAALVATARALQEKKIVAAQSEQRATAALTNMGGTGVRVLLEDAPQAPPSADAQDPHLLVLSAQTADALEQVTQRLRGFLLRSSSTNMSDVAFTLQWGRAQFPHRRILVCGSREDALSALDEKRANRVLTNRVEDGRRPIVFLLPGIGDQYVGMAHDLYATSDVFRQELDRCAQILEPHLAVDIRSVLYPANQSWKKVAQSPGIDLKRMLGRNADDPPDPDTIRLNSTLFAQPALFAIEYAMARLWLSLGVTPDAIVGHSMGEYVAACLAGVFSLEDALRLIATRAKLVNELPQATMLAVMLPEDELRALLPAGLFVSLINGPNHCVIAGATAAATEFEQALTAREIIARRVQNGHAFHTQMMDPILEPFAAEASKVRLSRPRIPYISNVSGTWVTDAQATDPTYWVKHANHTARFNDALARMWQLPKPILIECGPGRTLSVLAAQHPDRKGGLQGGIWSIRQRYENERDEKILLSAVGKVWLAGRAISWNGIPPRASRRRIPLPTYPHEKERCWAAHAPVSTPEAPQQPHPADRTVDIQGDAPSNRREQELVAIWQNALGRRHVGVNDSFGALGGDSLSSIGALLEMKRLGIPDDAARGLYRGLTIRQIVRQELAAQTKARTGKILLSFIETPVFVRALAIFLIVAGHFGMTTLVGFQSLMVVSGFSFAKFQLKTIEKERSVRPVFQFMLRIAVPTLLYVMFLQFFFHSINVRSWFFFDNWIDPALDRHFGSPYFIDLLLQNLAIAAVPLSFSAVREFAVKRAFLYGMIFLGVSWLASVIIPRFWDTDYLYHRVPHMQLWLFAVGWCAAYSATTREKLILSATLLCLSAISFLFGHGIAWDTVVASLAIAWFVEIPAQLPLRLVRVISAVAGASLFIYLTHFQFNALIHKLWTDEPPLLSVATAILGGFFVWKAWNYVSRIALGWFGKVNSSLPASSW